MIRYNDWTENTRKGILSPNCGAFSLFRPLVFPFRLINNNRSEFIGYKLWEGGREREIETFVSVVSGKIADTSKLWRIRSSLSWISRRSSLSRPVSIMANVADTRLYDILGVSPSASENELKKVRVFFKTNVRVFVFIGEKREGGKVPSAMRPKNGDANECELVVVSWFTAKAKGFLARKLVEH